MPRSSSWGCSSTQLSRPSRVRLSSRGGRGALVVPLRRRHARFTHGVAARRRRIGLGRRGALVPRGGRGHLGPSWGGDPCPGGRLRGRGPGGGGLALWSRAQGGEGQDTSVGANFMGGRGLRGALEPYLQLKIAVAGDTE